MISPEQLWPTLESLGEPEVRKRLAPGVYGEQKIPVIREWLATKESARQENREGQSLSLAEEANSIAAKANPRVALCSKALYHSIEYRPPTAKP